MFISLVLDKYNNNIINMKISQLIAIAALLNTNIEEVAAIQVNRHHHHHHQHYIQTSGNEDILTKDPKFAEL